MYLSQHLLLCLLCAGRPSEQGASAERQGGKTAPVAKLSFLPMGCASSEPVSPTPPAPPQPMQGAIVSPRGPGDRAKDNCLSALKSMCNTAVHRPSRQCRVTHNSQ